MAEQTQSLRVILDRLMRNPLLTDLSFEAAIQYTVDFMRIVGVPRMFEDKIEDITITAYKGLLPIDWVDTTSVGFIIPTSIEAVNTTKVLPMRYTTNTFHLDPDSQNSIEHTYMIQNSLIITSVEAGTVRMSYKAISIDEDGFPLLIDNSNFTRALENYIKLQHYTILFELGKIQPAVYQNVQQMYAWAVGACETDMHRLDLPRAESFFNMMNTLIIRNNEYNNKFTNSGSKEFLIRK